MMAEQRIIVRGHRFELWETTPDGRRHRLLRCYCGYGRKGFALPPASGESPASGAKREGDGRTPVGVFPLEFAFGLAPAPVQGAPATSLLPYRRITPYSFWSSERETYNTWIELPAEVFQVSQTAGHLEQNRPVLTPVSQKTGHLDQSGFPEGKNAGGLEQSKVPDGERLADYPVQYKYAAVIGYNTVEPQFGAGSAIFLHCYGPRKSWFQCRSKRTATAGCISIPEKIMVRILRVLRPGAVIDIQA